MQKLKIVREVRMRVTGHATPRDGAAGYERHDFEREAYAAVEKLAAELERVGQSVPISGGGVGAWGAGKTTLASDGGRMPSSNSRHFLELRLAN